MNGRIRELAEQARKYAFEKVENSQDPTEWSTKYYNEMFDEKFAELIVQECCDLIMKNQYNMVPGFMERMSAYSEICMLKKHFGVDQ